MINTNRFLLYYICKELQLFTITRLGEKKEDFFREIKNTQNQTLKSKLRK